MFRLVLVFRPSSDRALSRIREKLYTVLNVKCTCTVLCFYVRTVLLDNRYGSAAVLCLSVQFSSVQFSSVQFAGTQVLLTCILMLRLTGSG